MPTLTSILQPAVSGINPGSQPKIYNAQPPGSFATGPQVMPTFKFSNNYIVLYHLLDPDTRVNDVITYYTYPIPSAGIPTVTICTVTLTLQYLTPCINNKREHFEFEAFYKFPRPGTYDVYFEQVNASGTYNVISQNLRFIVQ